MNWTRLQVNDGSGEILIGTADARTLRLRLGGSSPINLARHVGSPAAWELTEWLIEQQSENFSFETCPPNRCRRLSSREAVKLVGDEHSDWVKRTVVRSLSRLRVLQEGSNTHAADEEFARAAAAAETRLLGDARTAWPTDPGLRPIGCNPELLTATFRADFAEFVARVSDRPAIALAATKDVPGLSNSQLHGESHGPTRDTATAHPVTDLRGRFRAPIPKIVMFVALACAAGTVTVALAIPAVPTRSPIARDVGVRFFLVRTFDGQPKVTRLERFKTTPAIGVTWEQYEDGHSAHAISKSTYKLIASIEDKLHRAGQHRRKSKAKSLPAPQARIKVVTWQGRRWQSGKSVHTRRAAPTVKGGDSNSSSPVTPRPQVALGAASAQGTLSGSSNNVSHANSESLVIVEDGANALSSSTVSGSAEG
jgi:hypothetical protein